MVHAVSPHMNDTSSATQNTTKTRMIFFFFILFTTTLGFLVGKSFDAGLTGAVIALVVSAGYIAFVILFSEAILLRSLNSKAVNRNTNEELYHRLTELSSAAGIFSPTLFFIDDPSIHAVSLGANSKKTFIILTRGLMDKLTSSEIEAVLAHEIAHLRVLDTKVGQYAVLTVSLFTFLAETLRKKSKILLPFALFFLLLSPLSAVLMHLVVSPKREFEADAAGVLITRYPDGLAQALEKMAQDQHHFSGAMFSTAHLFTIHPFHGKADKPFSSLFNTHPPIQERIRVLRSM